MNHITLRAPEVRAALDTGVVEIVRAVKFTEFGPSDTPGYDWNFRDPRGNWHDIRQSDIPHHCPYGKPGERRWVCETWRLVCPWECRRDNTTVQYRADKKYEIKNGWPDSLRIKTNDGPDRWRPSAHMSRWASRLTVEITDVRVRQDDSGPVWVITARRVQE